MPALDSSCPRRPGRQSPHLRIQPLTRGWTQRELADALGVAEQQVQRYEATEYRSASLARICDVAAALDIAVTERVVLGNPGAA